MKTELSIIVPIYNTGRHLNKCLESLLLQTLKNIEIILVNDGSEDDSGEICNDFASKDNRIKVIHKENEGVSIARNIGIKVAKGEYIGFVDSDDWIEENMFEEMVTIGNREQVDVVMCDAATVYGNGKKEIDTISLLSNSSLIDFSNISPQLLLQLAGSVWRCIYKKDLLNKHEILFPTGLKFSEDRIFNILAFGYGKKIYYDKCVRYNRFIRKGSAVNRYYNNMLDIVLTSRKLIRDAIDVAWDGRKDLKDAYETQTVGLALSAIYNNFHKDCKKSFFSRYRNIKSICCNEIIQNSLKVNNSVGIGHKLLLRKQVFFLCLMGIIFNIKSWSQY